MVKSPWTSPLNHVRFLVGAEPSYWWGCPTSLTPREFHRGTFQDDMSQAASRLGADLELFDFSIKSQESWNMESIYPNLWAPPVWDNWHGHRVASALGTLSQGLWACPVWHLDCRRAIRTLSMHSQGPRWWTLGPRFGDRIPKSIRF